MKKKQRSRCQDKDAASITRKENGKMKQNEKIIKATELAKTGTDSYR